MSKRVVITGIGVVSPIGIGKEEFWDNALKGHSGIKKLTRFDTKPFPTSLGATVDFFNASKFIKKNTVENLDITAQFAIASSVLALLDASLEINKDNKDNIGVVIGTTLGPITFVLDQQMVLANKGYLSVHKHLGYIGLDNCLTADVSTELGIRGSSEVISSACISSIPALDCAVKKIKYDNYNAMFVGGAESAFSPLTYAGLNIIKALTNNAVKPFDERADGTVLGEGSAMFVIEELEYALKRKATIYCEVCGTESLCEAHDRFKRDRNGEIGIRAIDNAMKKSHVNKEDIDFINVHGMGVLHFDIFEAMVLNKYFGELLKNIPITSIKPLVGHPMAAASALQIAITALAIKEGTIPPTLNTEKILKNSNLNIVREKPIKKDIKAALVNSYAFGGKCASCVLKKV